MTRSAALSAAHKFNRKKELVMTQELFDAIMQASHKCLQPIPAPENPSERKPLEIGYDSDYYVECMCRAENACCADMMWD